MLFKRNALRQHPLFLMKKVFVGGFLLALAILFVRGQRVVISPIVPGGSGGGVTASDVTNIVNSISGGSIWTVVSPYITTVTSAPVVIHTTNLANTFAYGLHFNKRGTTGDALAAVTSGSELGNMFWSGWDGAAYRQGGLIVTKSDVDFTPTEAMTHMEFRFVPTNSGTYSEFFRMTTAPGAGGSQTNPMLTFQGVTIDSAAIKRHARGLHIRTADDSGWGELMSSNFTMHGNFLIVSNGIVGFNPALRLYAGGGGSGGWTDFVHGNTSGATNRISFTFGSNTPAAGQLMAFHSVTANGSTNSILVTNIPATALAGVFGNDTGLIYASPTYLAFRVGFTNDATLWASTNLGVGSIGFGTNNRAGGFFSSILGGSHNLIPTNNLYSIIVGGISNVIGGLGHGGNLIVGGMQNFIAGGSAGPYGTNNIIVGGIRNTNRADFANNFIGGGYNNQIHSDLSVIVGGRDIKLGNGAGDRNFIGGGSGHQMGGSTGGSVISGGVDNTNSGTLYGFLGGGNGNVHLNSSYGTIGGGFYNSVQSGPNGFIGGGTYNLIENCPNSFIPGGASNWINSTANSVTYSSVIGNFGTNRTSRSVLISPMGTHGSNALHVTADATTNIGPLRVKVGAAAAYASVGGTLTNATTAIGSAGTGATNLLTYMYLGNMLTNTGDRLVVRASGKFSPVADAKHIRLFFGSENVFDSGSQTANAGAWVVMAEIIRTGNTSQAVNASYSGSAESLYVTANSLDLVQTNGINTLLGISVTCAANGGVTNRTLTVTYYPANP